MKKINFLLKTMLIILSLSIVSCDEEDYGIGELTAPSNINLTLQIQGADTDNPNGDGSGIVNFAVSADDAISYKFILSDGEVIAPSGKAEINFSRTGTFSYNVTVVAIGKGGITSTASVETTVLVLYDPPASLKSLIYGDGVQQFRVKSESGGHFGVGPANGNSPIWYQASANEKSSTGMYDDVYQFNSDGTFTHLTQGTVFGQGGPIDQEMGAASIDKNDGGEYENYPLADYSERWSLSAPGGEETLSLTGKAFISYYIGGSHKYTIVSRTSDEMVLKSVGLDGNAWFVTLIKI
ncbi:PKD domain-containing protein [Flavobacteriaceae bacterium]|nr:PKD domain-containing protein [Flavobacteriaceae bacterium]